MQVGRFNRPQIKHHRIVIAKGNGQKPAAIAKGG